MKDRFEAIKEVDISPLFESAGSEHSATDTLIAGALATDGAFVATGLPDNGNLDQKISDLMGFFDLPLEKKLGCAVRNYQPGNSNTYRGYYPLPEVADWTHKEYFDIGPEPAINIPDIPGGTSFCETNVWPQEGDLPNWRSEMVDRLRQLRDLACVLMTAIARGLDLDSKPFVDASAGRNASMRLLSRPVLAESPQASTSTIDEEGFLNDLEVLADGRQIVTGRHVDENLLSILWQSSAGGLQMEGRDGVWKEVYPLPGTLSVHCGTLLASLTGDRLTGTPHRVASDGTYRTSMGHFLEPDFEANVCAPESGAPVTYAQHLVNLFPDRFAESGTA
jgi:isopenicillin N synthase-like dioxygenase